MNTEPHPTPDTDAFVLKWQNADPARALVELTELHRSKERELAESKAQVLNLSDALQWTLGMKPSPCRCLPFGLPPHVCLAHRAINAAMAAQH